MKAKQFDKKFDSGEDITKYLDVSKAHRPEQEQRRVNVDFPIWMIQSLDKEAKRLGVPRQSIIKVWVAERLEKKARRKSNEQANTNLSAMRLCRLPDSPRSQSWTRRRAGAAAMQFLFERVLDS